MIIEKLLDLLSVLLEKILGVFDIPELPPEVDQVVSTFVEYLTTGIAILQNYTHMDYLLTLFGIVVAFEVCVAAYHGIMWVLRKIPMFGIS